MFVIEICRLIIYILIGESETLCLYQKIIIKKQAQSIYFKQIRVSIFAQTSVIKEI